ncbi:hypothetical protein [Desulfococcus sp.]|uniref:hypothetical protein n=1 Tax=Desulfococcus sp. TaxID=2025834 RepID=UPI0035946174
MKSDKQYQKIEGELDRIVQAELHDRIGSRLHPKNPSDIGEIFEHRNRQIVTAHQQGTISDILYPIFISYLQSRDGGRLHLSPESVKPEAFSAYTPKKERFETLFSAAIMALQDRDLADIVTRMRAIFDEHHRILKEINRLAETVRHIRKKAANTAEAASGRENHAVGLLTAQAPLKADLRAIESHCVAFRENIYLKAAAQHLETELQAADRVIAETGREASKCLFDNAGAVFHAYRSTPVSLSNTEQFMAQKEELARYAKIFESIGLGDRKEQIDRYIATIDGALEKLRQEIERQKENEARLAEKHQQEIGEAYARFLEIKDQFAGGLLAAESQRKNAAEKLKQCRDTLIANGQRVMARDIDRFLNATGIGKPPGTAAPPRPAGAGEDTFDYKKGFLILLPVSVTLLFLLLLLLIL